MSIAEQETILVHKISVLNTQVDAYRRLLAKVRGGQKVELIDKDDRLDLLSMRDEA